jgi:uncharacterized protein
MHRKIWLSIIGCGIVIGLCSLFWQMGNNRYLENNPEAYFLKESSSAQEGNAKAEFKTGICYIEGRGTAIDRVKGETLIQSAAGKGVKDAQIWLVNQALNEARTCSNTVDWLSTISAHDLEREWVEVTAKTDCPEAWARMGYYEFETKSGADWFSKSAAKGCPWGMMGMARWLLEHPSGEDFDNKAVAFWVQAAKMGQADAAYYLGLAYVTHRGGLPRDLAKAKEWLTIAKERGYLEPFIGGTTEDDIILRTLPDVR